jgi:hypothetical protein
MRSWSEVFSLSRGRKSIFGFLDILSGTADEFKDSQRVVVRLYYVVEWSGKCTRPLTGCAQTHFLVPTW